MATRPRDGDPHDRFFKQIFARPREARALIRAALPRSVVRRLDLRTLRPARGEFLDRVFRLRKADLLFSTRLRGRPALVWILFEHKSDLRASLALQLLGYVVLLLQEWEREHRGALLPFVIPIVVHHGARVAPEVIDLADRFDRESAPGLLPWMPSFRVPVFDLNRVGLGELLEHVGADSKLGAVALAMMKEIRGARILDVMAAAGPWLREIHGARGGAEELEQLLRYVLVAAREPPDFDALRDVMVREVHPESEEVVMTLAEKLRAEGLERGLEQGLEQGREEGRQAAEELLARLLAVRFGERGARAAERIAGASLEELRRWHEAALVAEDPDAVF